jgi:hypothetical protein
VTTPALGDPIACAAADEITACLRGASHGDIRYLLGGGDGPDGDGPFTPRRIRNGGRPTPEGVAQAGRLGITREEKPSPVPARRGQDGGTLRFAIIDHCEQGLEGRMRRHRLLERPLAPGLTTLRDYAKRIGYSPDYIRLFWGKRDGFPAPAGELPPRGRHGGGRGELVFDEKALDAFRATQADLWGRRPMQRVVTNRDLDERITPSEFAQQLAGVDGAVMARYQALDGFPEIGKDGRCRLGDLLAHWNTRPIVLAGHDPDERVILREAARIIGLAHKTISQYRKKAGFPPGRDGTYRLGDVVDFLNTGRPGKRGPAARDAA